MDLLDFLPLGYEDAVSIRARLDADANAGLDPSNDNYIDLSVGGFYYDVTQAAVLEIERLWDAVFTELPAAMLVDFAWGQYLDWHGDTWGVERKPAAKAAGAVIFNGALGTLIPIGTHISTESPSSEEEPVEFVTTVEATITASLSATVAVEAVEAGAAGNVAVGTITQLLSPLADISSIVNASATSGGADIENDESYRGRLLLELSSPQGAGNVADYERWATDYPGVSYATVVPLWDGAGTVKVIVTDSDNNPVAQGVLDGLQELLDPDAGQGNGSAPIGAIVTLATPSLTTVPIEATISFRNGYSLDGAGGTIACREAIETSVKTYVDHLVPGEDVILEHTSARLFYIEGVYDVTSVLLDGVAANKTIAADYIARAGTITLNGTVGAIGRSVALPYAVAA